MKLYEMVGNYKALMDMSDDIPEDALIDTLESITDELEVKGANIVKVMSNMDTSPIECEIKRLQAMKKSIDSRKAWLKSYLRDGMVSCDIDKIKWDTGSVTLRKAGVMVEITSEKDLPTEYKTLVPASWTVNKRQILSDLKAGIDIPGAELIDAKQGIIIR
jgi:hypothetical protein